MMKVLRSRKFWFGVVFILILLAGILIGVYSNQGASSLIKDWILIAIISMLLIAAGALLNHLLTKFVKVVEPPNKEDYLAAATTSINNWLRKGKTKKLFDHNSELLVPDSASGLTPAEIQEKKADLISWLKETPYTPRVKFETLSEGERDRLQVQFDNVFYYLIIVGIISAIIAVVFAIADAPLWVCLSAGMFGSCVAAFRSCLDRRANGFEDRLGNVAPDSNESKERFGDGMVSWFFGRPFLGAAVGLMIYFALKGDVFLGIINGSDVLENSNKLVFYALVGGLFAKTLLDIFLNITKGVFGV